MSILTYLEISSQLHDISLLHDINCVIITINVLKVIDRVRVMKLYRYS